MQDSGAKPYLACANLSTIHVFNVWLLLLWVFFSKLVQTVYPLRAGVDEYVSIRYAHGVLKMEQMSCCISIEKLTCVTCEFGRLYLVITFFVNLQDMWRRQLVRNCTIIQTQTLKKHILTSKCDNLKIFLCVTFVKHNLSYLCR